MSNVGLARFLRRVAEDGRLRAEFREMAGRHGFRITDEELEAVDFVGAAERGAAPPDDDDEEERSDPGFGVIEFPG